MSDEIPRQAPAAAEEDERSAVRRGIDTIRDTLESIDRFWFGWGSPTTLGLFRIIASSLSVLNFLMLLPDWDAWYTERGFVPAWIGARFVDTRAQFNFGVHTSIPILNLLGGITDPRINLAFFLLTIVAGILTAFGLWTRVSSILFALGVVTIHHRNAAILHGGDSVVRLSCLYLAIAPCGRACSVDRLIGLWKGKISSAPVLISMWPQRLIAANVAIVYLTTVWLKWQGGMWQDGIATYYPERLPEFHRFPVPSFINDFPFVYFTTYGTLLVEFSMATLVFFRPLRKYVLLAGILMHLHIEYSMNIPLFSYLMVSTYLCFYDGEEVSAWAGRIGERHQKWHVKIRIPAGMRLKPNAVGFFDSIDPFKLVQFLPGEQAVWAAYRGDDSTLPIVKALKSRCIGSWVFGWWPRVWDRILQNAVEANPMNSAPEAGR